MKPLLAALLSLPLAAQAAGAVVPDAGSLLQQIKPSAPPEPSPSETGLKIEPRSGVKLPPSAPFEVKAIRISGNTLFDTATLHALVAEGEGKKLDLSQLDELAARITDYYQSHGYPLARAIIPAQTIRDGMLDFEVIEARYGRIKLDNRSRVDDALLQGTLSPLQGGQVVGQREMDRALLLLSDIPGVAVNATLKSGEAVGTSDLQVEATAAPAFAAQVSVDNYGNRYTGKTRAGATVNFTNPLHHGDVLGATLLGSGSGLDYGRISYESLLNGLGTRIGGAYSAVHYVLGDTLAPLNAHGTAQVGSLWVRQPFMRSRDLNLYGQLQYDRKMLRDRIDTSAIRTDRHLGNWVLSLNGDLRDALLSGGVNTWSLAWTSGRVSFDDATAQAVDAATAGTQGSFSKWDANFARHQALTPENELYIEVAAQWANANLDSAEKMTVGGPYTVRAYDVGAASGDTGYAGSVEWRHDLRAGGGQWQAVAFVDSAHVTVNKSPWVGGANGATLSGAGVGLNWAGGDQWHAKAYIASRLGSTPALVANSSSTRAWVEIGKGF
ncbi:hypothetical protein FGKAn22_16710 [Ferrigenium kumadai]|uniref:Hemolysin activation/secretion protein n=1 Tax=Ferrigenium kumadai TaxID=1682490 RepID=A0AAN1W002_9PROT|nr:ShlB/FhaC/HecB family hemolysin secretion/activation protein [Ferrigenium kumadai]BBI99978.1 hypothetical protein FGKAn22_16710 [Ferrigenium kumadai]